MQLTDHKPLRFGDMGGVERAPRVKANEEEGCSSTWSLPSPHPEQPLRTAPSPGKPSPGASQLRFTLISHSPSPVFGFPNLLQIIEPRHPNTAGSNSRAGGPPHTPGADVTLPISRSN